MSNSSLEKTGSSPKGIESAPASVVVQPSKVEFAAFLDGISKMSESSASGPANDGPTGGSGGAVATTGGSTQSGQSARDLAIANLPASAVMQKELAQHIRMEVKKLRKQALGIARLNRPGAAHKLNDFYSRIRHLNAILAELFDASIDVLKRLFIRVFIDKQTIQ